MLALVLGFPLPVILTACLVLAQSGERACVFVSASIMLRGGASECVTFAIMGTLFFPAVLFRASASSSR